MNDLRVQPLHIRGLPLQRFERKPKERVIPKYALIFDAETTIDVYQSHISHCAKLYRVQWASETISLIETDSWLVHADRLRKFRPKTLLAINSVAAELMTSKSVAAESPIAVMSLSQFTDSVLIPLAKNPDVVISGFNLSFDMFSIVDKVTEARRQPFTGGFSATFPGQSTMRYKEAKAGIGHLRQFSWKDSHSKSAQIIDLSELVRALTETRHSLMSAGHAFGCKINKYYAEMHDPEVTYHGPGLMEHIKDYVRYNINDVDVTANLFEKSVTEALRHPLIRLDNFFSSAAVGKAYLRAMGLHPALCHCNKCRSNYLGAHKVDTDVIVRSMTGFFGARTDCLIRSTPLPAVYLDFTSDYPTQICLLGMWEISRAKYIDIREETSAVQALLNMIAEATSNGTVVPDYCYDPSIYVRFAGVAELTPDERDLICLRTDYRETGGTANIALAHMRDCDYSLCYSICDLVASAIQTGRAPQISRAWRIYPVDTQDNLQTVKLYGDIEFDPNAQNFFRFIIEERQKAKKRHRTETNADGWDSDNTKCLCPNCKIERFLKVLANSIGYGIFSEMNKDNSKGKSQTVGELGIIEGKTVSVDNPERVGEWNFPPSATVITGGARLFLSMLECELRSIGVSLMYCDTDSGIIPASRNGGISHGFKLATYEQVNSIRKRFNGLNPYDRTIVPELLKWEYPENLDEHTYAYCISTKHYCLYTLTGNAVKIVKASEHGLGLFELPTPSAIKEFWEYLIRKEALGQEPEQPSWFNLPAMRKWPVKTWHSYKALEQFNTAKKPWQRILPYRFALAPVLAMEKPIEGNSEDEYYTYDVRLITPKSSPDSWEGAQCVDLHTHEFYSITTDYERQSDHCMWVKNWRFIYNDYVNHTESKYNDINGNHSTAKTKGQLIPTTVMVSGCRIVSKDGSALYPEDDPNEAVGVRTYTTDELMRAFTLTRKYFNINGFDRYAIMNCANISERQANKFLADNLNLPTREALERGIEAAARLARKEVSDITQLKRPGACAVLTVWSRAFDKSLLSNCIRLPAGFLNGGLK